MKFEVNEKELAVKLLVMLMQEKMEKEVTIKYTESNMELKKKAESDSLFYWILSRLYHVADSKIPARPHTTITVKGRMNQWNKVLLTQGHQGEYLPLYIEGNEFFDVVEGTLKIFDSFEKFSAHMLKRDEESCEFCVSF